jgi:hypothetical protein
MTKQIGAPVRAAFAAQSIALHANRLLLKPLPARAIEELVRSAFVDAPEVKFVSEWVAGLSEGNPAKIVELLRYLVDHDLVQFRDGAWLLPEDIDPRLLPRDVADALRARIRELSSAARDLAETLAVLVRPANIDDVRALFEASRAPVEAAAALPQVLDELSAADLVSVDTRSIAIARPALREMLLQDMSPLQLRAAHARIGRALAHSIGRDDYDASVDLATAHRWAVSAYHLLLGEELQRGVALWMNAVRYTFEIDYVPIWDGNLWYLDANLLALAAAEKLGMSRSKIVRLRTSAVQSAVQPDMRLLAYGEETLRELEIAAGLDDYHACAALQDPRERCEAATRLALERWHQSDDASRPAHPLLARALLIGMTFGLSFIYGHTLNARALAALPAKLAPFVPSFPAFAVFKLLLEAVHAQVTGRTQHELELRIQGIAAIQMPVMSPPVITYTLRDHILGCWLYGTAMLEAVRDPAAGLARVATIEAETPFMTFGTWQARLLAHVYECNAVEVQACAERVEMASMQYTSIAKYHLYAGGLQPLAAAYALAGDVLGLKGVIEKLQPFAQSVATWQPYYAAARASYHRLLGQLPLARALAERAAAAVIAGEHRGYGFVTLTLLRVRFDLDEIEAVHHAACEAIACARRCELGPELEAQLLALDALALARLGSHVRARQQGESALQLAERAGFTGLLRGEIHRDLAGAALLARDVPAFERHAGAVAKHTCAHHHPVLLARYEHLLGAAAVSGMAESVKRAGAAIAARTNDLRALLTAELHRRSDARSLAERVLELMVERAGVSDGLLFGLEDGALRLLAPEGADVPSELTAALQACLDAERAVAARAHNTMTATRASVVRIDNGQVFQVAVLHAVGDDGSLRASGAIALRIHDELPAIPRWDCVLALATVLGGQDPCAGSTQH